MDEQVKKIAEEMDKFEEFGSFPGDAEKSVPSNLDGEEIDGDGVEEEVDIVVVEAPLLEKLFDLVKSNQDSKVKELVAAMSDKCSGEECMALSMDDDFECLKDCAEGKCDEEKDEKKGPPVPPKKDKEEKKDNSEEDKGNPFADKGDDLEESIEHGVLLEEINKVATLVVEGYPSQSISKVFEVGFIRDGKDFPVTVKAWYHPGEAAETNLRRNIHPATPSDIEIESIAGADGMPIDKATLSPGELQQIIDTADYEFEDRDVDDRAFADDSGEGYMSISGVENCTNCGGIGVVNGAPCPNCQAKL